jgi:hypothetical protein
MLSKACFTNGMSAKGSAEAAKGAQNQLVDRKASIRENLKN